MSPEQELLLSREIEQGRRSVAEALVRSRPALDELERRAREACDGSLEVASLLALAFQDGRASRNACQHVIGLIGRVRIALAERTKRTDDLDRARADLVEALLRYDLQPGLLREVLAQLREAQRTARTGKQPSLTATIAAIERGRERANRARAKFVEANQGLVFMLANKRLKQGLALDDLVQEGNLGLMRAADKFDHRRGLRFSTYATWWIRHALNRALSDQSRTIRIPVHLLEAEHKLGRRTSVYERHTGEQPSERVVLEQMQITPEKLALVRAIPRQPCSLDDPVGPDGDRRLGDTIADERSPSPLEELSHARAGVELQTLLETLTPREREVLDLRFGMGRSDELTLTQIGQCFSLSRERIRQIEVGALNKLRRQAEANELAAS